MCQIKINWSKSLTESHYLETPAFKFQTATGLKGIINAIKWVGFKEWIEYCIVNWNYCKHDHKLIDANDIYNIKSGN